MELVDVETKIFALVFWDVGARHGGGLEFHDEDHTQELRVEFASFTFAEVDEEDFAVVHDFFEVEAAFCLADDVAHHFVTEEGAEFTDEPAENFGLVGFTGLRHFFVPEVEYGLVGDVLEFFICESLVVKDLRNIDEGGSTRVAHDSEGGVSEPVFVAWADNTGTTGVVEAVEHGDSFLDEEVALILGFKFEKIEADRRIHVTRVEIDDVVDALWRDHAEELFGGVAVGIDESETFTIGHVLIGKVFEEDGLTDTSLTYYICMATAIFGAEADGFFDAAKFVNADEKAFLHNVSGAVDLFGHLALDLGGGDVALVGEMKERSELDAVKDVAIGGLWEEAEDERCDEAVDIFCHIELEAVVVGRVEEGERGDDVIEEGLRAGGGRGAGDDADKGFVGWVASFAFDRLDFCLFEVCERFEFFGGFAVVTLWWFPKHFGNVTKMCSAVAKDAAGFFTSFDVFDFFDGASGPIFWGWAEHDLDADTVISRGAGEGVKEGASGVAFGLLVGGNWVDVIFFQSEFATDRAGHATLATEDIVVINFLEARGGICSDDGLFNDVDEYDWSDCVVMDEAAGCDDFKRDVALAVEFAFEAFCRGRADDVIHDLRLGKHFLCDVALVTAADFDVVGARRKMDEHGDHF